MGIGSFGLTEIIAIVVLVLLFFGPREMPEIARSLGRVLRDLRRNVNELVREFEELERMENGSRADRPSDRRDPGPRPGDPVVPPGAREDGPDPPRPEEEAPEEKADGEGRGEMG